MRTEEEIKEEIRKWKAERAAYQRGYKKDPIRRHKVNAREKVRKAIRAGHLKKGKCFCGEKVVEAHHENYDLPLQVIWLCKKHHTQKTYPSARLTSAHAVA